MGAAAPAPPLFVVDDDPTGAQGQADVPLLLSWRGGLIEAALSEGPAALHLLTNSRALDPDEAYAIVRDASTAALAADPHARVVLRGDSTLRAHLLPEYNAVRDALYPGTTPPLLLVPALPAAGRVTTGGRHWLIRDGRRTPLERTEFATDGEFAYDTARLIDWAEARSHGFFAAADGVEIGIDEVRADDGANRIAAALLAAARGGRPAVVVPDAETCDDLAVIAEGLRTAWLDAPTIVVRCAPTFASVLSGAGAKTRSELPAIERGLLVVVGSHVPMSSAQLATLNTAHPEALVELGAETLAAGGPGAEAALSEAVAAARSRLRDGRLAVVATSRAVSPVAVGPEPGMRIARALARLVGELRDSSDVLLSKGGITSAVNVREGLGADRAQIVGPVAPGVSLWHAFERDGGPPHPVIVFPGNVGDTTTLAELVERLLGD
jgi:uncharacterized protein YgbK (DUF1537 family)